MNLPDDLLDKLQAYAYSGALGAFAALVGYLYQLAKAPGNKVNLVVMLATIVIGFYLGILFGGFIPKNWENRDAVLLLVGATGLKGFELVVSWARAAVPNLMRALISPGSSPGQGPGDEENRGS